MIRSACYVACDRCNGNPAQISTDDARDARVIARSEGYIRTLADEDVCPPCAGKTWDGARWAWPEQTLA